MLDLRSERIDRIIPTVGQYGLTYLGRGAFSVAFLMMDGRVLKVGSEADDGFAFNQWAHENMGDDGVPNVYEVRRVPGGWYCIMERVTTAQDSGWGYADETAEAAAYRFAEETGGSASDLHEGNWGHTQDGRSVVIDPTGCGRDIGLPEVPPQLLKRQHGPRHPRAARWQR